MPIKKIRTLQALKNTLKKTLPTQISNVIKSYEVFADQQVPEDAKGFSAHHSACKSAVVHAETLLKLARWTEDDLSLEKDNKNVDDDLASILQDARKEDVEFEEEE